MAAQDKRTDEAIAAIQPVVTSDAAKAAMEKLQKDLSAYRTARTALMQAQPQPGAPVDNLPQMKPVHDLGGTLSEDFAKIEQIGMDGAKQETAGRFRFDTSMSSARFAQPQPGPAIRKPQLPPAAAKKRPQKIALTEEEGFGKY